MTGRSRKLKWVNISNARKRRDFLGQAGDERRLAKSKDLMNENLVDWNDKKYDPIALLIKDVIDSLKDMCPMYRRGLCTGFLDSEFKIVIDWRMDIIGWEAAVDATTYPCKVLLTLFHTGSATYVITRGGSNGPLL